jgi:CRP/FNR family transcriptional regulator
MKTDQLKAIPLFSSLTDKELTEAGNSFLLKKYKKNETILQEEDTNEYMYIILSGKVKVVQFSTEGKEIILAIHKSGDFFGELSLIDGETVPAAVIATEEATAAILSKRSFYSMLAANPKTTHNLLRILCSRLRDSWDRIALLNFRNAAQRIKMLLLALSRSHGQETGEEITLNMRFTHQNIADMTGLTRETVTRIIDRWQKSGEITVHKNKTLRFRHEFLREDSPDVI